MRRNKYFELDKEYRALAKKYDELWEAKRNLGWIELDKPKPSGWIATLVPRADVARRKDADVFIEICERFCQSVTSRRKDFKYRCWKDRKWKHSTPHIRRIREREYEKLSPALQKQFTKSLFPKTHWDLINPEYYCIIPSFYFVVKISRNYITHVREFDEVIERELSWVSDKRADAKFNPVRGYSWFKWNAPKHYRKMLNKKRRLQHKREVKAIVDDERYVRGFDDNYKDGPWYW
jgi:hypothetical protein